MKAIVKVIVRYYPDSTTLTHLKLFNHPVLELGAWSAPLGRTLTLADNVDLVDLRLVNLWAVFQATDSVGGSLTVLYPDNKEL